MCSLLIDIKVLFERDMLAGRIEPELVCLFVYSRTSNFSAIWRLSPLPVTGLKFWPMLGAQGL
jgi:hypothetical protein